MKILFDHQTFTLQEYGGISRIYAELLMDSPLHPETETSVSILFSNNEYLSHLKKISYSNFLKNSKWQYKTSLMMKLNKMATIVNLRWGNFDVFHPTYYDFYFLKYLKGRPFVVTFLDMIHEKFGHIYPELANDRVTNTGKKLLLQSANKIIAISQSTKNDIVDIYGIDPGKIEVIYLGSSMPKAKVDAPGILENNYILFVGNRGRYKNWSFFLESIANLLSGLHVVCAGGGRFTEEEREEIEKLNLQGKVHYEPIKNDASLANLYVNALCFVFPSLYEGFGIPVLEAFSCGCPCVLSDRSSLPEVGGDAAIYFDPEDSSSINKAVSTLINDDMLRESLVQKGYERIKQFSWEKTRDQTYKLYASLL